MNATQAKQEVCAWISHFMLMVGGTDFRGAMTCPTCSESPSRDADCADCRRLAEAWDELERELDRRGDKGRINRERAHRNLEALKSAADIVE